jgi:hypothetical protein
MGSLRGGVLLHVAEGQEGGLYGPRGEVHVLELKDNGVRGPSPSVADVGQGDLDGVGNGGRSLA